MSSHRDHIISLVGCRVNAGAKLTLVAVIVLAATANPLNACYRDFG